MYCNKDFFVTVQIFHVKQRNLFRKLKQSDEEKWETKMEKAESASISFV